LAAVSALAAAAALAAASGRLVAASVQMGYKSPDQQTSLLD